METHQQTRQPKRSAIARIINKLLLLLIRFYQWFISPWLGKNCRFYPSCSCYAQEALEKHGPWRGVWFSVKRILKCHPWHPGGIDMVPDPKHPPHSPQ